MDYMIADSDKKRCNVLQKRIDIYRSANFTGRYSREVELLEKVWIERPRIVLVYVGDGQLNPYSILKRIKEITPEVNVVFYSEQTDYAMDAYEKGADYFLPLPADDIQIGKLVFRYIGSDKEQGCKDTEDTRDLK